MSPTILIADEDRESARLYEHYLNRCGYRVLSASGGVECLSIIREQSPPLLSPRRICRGAEPMACWIA